MCCDGDRWYKSFKNFIPSKFRNKLNNVFLSKGFKEPIRKFFFLIFETFPNIWRKKTSALYLNNLFIWEWWTVKLNLLKSSTILCKDVHVRLPKFLILFAYHMPESSRLYSQLVLLIETSSSAHAQIRPGCRELR